MTGAARTRIAATVSCIHKGLVYMRLVEELLQLGPQRCHVAHDDEEAPPEVE
jgi:hypothetical protein